jgi:hypothetical protein
MVDGFNFKQLKAAVLASSHAADWDIAKKEWRLIAISEAHEPETCICGHFPIIELCTIFNASTRSSLDVGNVCVKRFLGFRSDLIFQSLKRVRADQDKAIGPDATAFFYERGVINDWEYKFQQSTMRKRILSERQLAIRCIINQKVLEAVRRRGLA